MLAPQHNSVLVLLRIAQVKAHASKRDWMNELFRPTDPPSPLPPPTFSVSRLGTTGKIPRQGLGPRIPPPPAFRFVAGWAFCRLNPAYHRQHSNASIDFELSICRHGNHALPTRTAVSFQFFHEIAKLPVSVFRQQRAFPSTKPTI